MERIMWMAVAGALAALVKRNPPGVLAGPDVWEPTRKLYPKAFAADRLHPNAVGAKVMAQLWFERLLTHDGLPVPPWSRKEMADAVGKAPPAEPVRPRQRPR